MQPHSLFADILFSKWDQEGSRPMKALIQIAALAALIIPTVQAQSTIFGGNLIVNGGAESGAAGNGTAPVSSVPGWSRTAGCDIYAYGAAYSGVNGIAPTDIVPRGAAYNYFAGGSNPASCTFTQSIDLSSGAAAIDGGNVTFAVSAYLGGYGSDSDNASLTVVLEDGGGNQLLPRPTLAR